MTRIEGRKDDNLLLEKGGQGFPHIVFMDDEGGIVAVQGERTVEGFQKTLKGKVQEFLALSAKAKSGDAAAQIDFAILEGEIGRIPFADMQKRLEGKKLSDAQKAALGDVELGMLIGDVRKAQDEATARAAMKKVADAYAAGRVPGDNERKMEFFSIILQHGLMEEDADLAQKGYDAVKPLYEEAYGKDNPKLQNWLQQISEKIADLKSSKEGGDEAGIEEGGGEESEGGK